MSNFVLKILCMTLVFSVVCVSSDDGLPKLKKSFMIVKSTTSYPEAKEFAIDFSQRSGITLSLKSLQPHEHIGVTHTPKQCSSWGYSYPCYVARGRYDDGHYVSIEFSDAYEGFAKGYYVVMAVSDEKISQTLLEKIQKIVPDAYIKGASVYMGCIH